eukprot:scaffold34829_cov15-Tisochrysis_lutea.AAC.1
MVKNKHFYEELAEERGSFAPAEMTGVLMIDFLDGATLSYHAHILQVPKFGRISGICILHSTDGANMPQ